MPPEQLDRYQIIEPIGRGAMGVVYKALDPRIGRIVAVKTIALELSREEAEAFERRFYREATSAGRLNHPNIVTIYDVGKTGAVAYIAMEFLQGTSLRQILDSGVVLPAEKIVDIAAQVADGLAFAHDNGIVHRDIKPPNIMVLDNGLVKITDFGIALLPSGSSTQAGSVFGSPKYMAPEQVVGRPLDGRVDVFSLGAVLYEMLTGLPPFFGGELGALLYQVINEMPAAPSSRNRSIAPAFDYIVAKAMAKHPDDRYPSAGAMAFDLRHFQTLELPGAVPSEVRTLERRAMRRRKGDTVAAPIVAVATAASSASPSEPATADGSSPQRPKLLVFAAVVAVLAALVSWGLLSMRPSSPLGARAAVDEPALASVSAPASSTREELPPAEHPGADASTSVLPATPPPAPRLARAAPVAARPGARLALAVTPWGEIFVDGRRRGVAPPLTEIKLPPGKHVIELRNSAFPPYTETVVLEAGALVKIKHRFQ